MLGTLLAIGLLTGIRHALEADHVAAVASLATRSTSVRQTAWLAAVWGTGHAAALLIVGGVVVALGAAMPSGLARLFEVAAGLLLVALGIDVLRRLRRQKIHLHVHRHDGGLQHVHLHSHDGQAVSHEHDAHRHAHPRGLLLRAGVMGSLHGMAGSAALVVLSLQAVSSPARALAYMAVFAAGSVTGMVLFSLVIALPARLRGPRLSGAARGFEAALGAVSVAIGAWMVVRAGLGH
jgi:ABC-type nickel/cobalt efflux system permease component RcnA